MGRITGWLLLALAAFMFVGFLNAGVGGPAALAALLLVVVLPAAGGVALLRGAGSRAASLPQGRERLRQETLQSEMLRLAAQHDGRLTVVEAVTSLAISPDDAKQALDALSVRGLADFEVTESGVVVYVFHDIRKLGEKHDARGLLE